MSKTIFLRNILVCSAIVAVLLSFSPATFYADEIGTAKKSKIIVSLGDSYSSGEGIDDFYGSELPIAQRVDNVDWLAHRSKNAWSGMLTLPEVSGEMSKHRNDNWYFVASSGAETEHLEKSQKKSYKKTVPLTAITYKTIKGDTELEPQINVFNKLERENKKADYVTLTLGGNDADFAGIVSSVTVGSTYLNFSGLKDKISNVWEKFYSAGGIRDNLKAAYKLIAEKAGEQATVIVAGYPKLYDQNGKGKEVSKEEAKDVNEAVSNFNQEIALLVEECQKEHIKIEFVSVEDEFENHGAYSDDPWINSLEMVPKEQDISEYDIKNRVFASAYSLHPNYNGAYNGYRKCVQDRIDYLEKQKKQTLESNVNTENKARPNEINVSNQADRDIVLVLDVSGSMEGTPINETKRAAEKFVDTIIEQDAGTGIVEYNSSAEIVSAFSNDSPVLKDAISSINADGGTNIEDGLIKAESMLANSSANKKIIVLMSDGEPNRGKEGEELIAYADELKKKGIYIYTLGFFENVEYKAGPQYLMEMLASDGCHYEVSDADSLVYFFGDIADQISGQKYIYVRIACPVDVSVSLYGETLDSSEKGFNTRTSFGTLTFEDANTQTTNSVDSYNSIAELNNDTDRVKILRLKEGDDYNIKIEGTGRGKMNYSIGFMDENGEYSDFRRFNNIKITRKTQIDTVAEVSDKTVLNVDEDGDGKYDLTYEAKTNERGKVIDNSFKFYIVYVIVGGLGFIVIVSIIINKIKKQKKNVRRDYNG
ncbi:MAG: VWA domain-containing protein [Clostridia bacterium]|nr:VWA domain-containing protein [Clostridia bacterium]